MKNFIHIIPSLEAGGAETQLVNFVKYEKENGYNPIVISLKKQDTVLKKELENIHVLVKEFNFRRFSILFSFFALLYFFITLERKRYTLVAWMYHAMAISIIVKFFKPKIKVLWLIRRTQVPKGLTGFISKLNAFFSYLVPTSIVCNAAAAVTTHQNMGYQKCKFSVIPNGIDSNKFTAVQQNYEGFRAEYEIKQETRVFGMIARYAPVKGHYELLSALKLIEDEDFICVLVGRDIEKAPNLQSLLNDEILSKRIILLGERTDIPTLLNIFDFLVLPSLSEGFPNVVAEAMASKTPCIVTNVGDSEKIVAQTGLIIESNNISALASAIDIWINKPLGELDTLGESARERIIDQYSVASVAMYYRDII